MADAVRDGLHDAQLAVEQLQGLVYPARPLAAMSLTCKQSHDADCCNH